MKNTWVLLVKTSLPGTFCNAGELKTNIYTFDCFDEARTALRKMLKKYAFSKNSMFDGKGNIVHLHKYIEDLTAYDYSDFDDDNFITSQKLKAVERSLKNVFKGKDVVPKIMEGFYTNYMIAYTYENGEISFCGGDGDPCSLYAPVLRTNMFDMHEENNYFLYIDDLVGLDENTSELYIDLIHAEEFCNE